MEDINEMKEFFDKNLLEPEKLVEGMTYDDFVEWVEIGTIEEIEDAILTFANAEMYQHVDIMKICANRKRHEDTEKL